MSRCPSCQAELPQSAVISALQAARCPSCGALVDLQGRGVVRFQPVAAPLAALPERWRLDEGAGRFAVSWRWFSLVSLFMIPFTLFWNGILLVFAAAGTELGRHPERLLFGLAVPHVWVGIGLAYGTLGQLLNSTRVEVEGSQLVVRHGPLPWLGNRRLEVAELEQLFVVERARRRSVGFELCALLKDGRKKVILSGLDSLDQARFLEVRLEAVLGIVDRPVAGERR